MANFTPHWLLFFGITNRSFIVANDILNADTGVTGNSMIVCYVEVLGTFTLALTFPSKDTKQPILHHRQMVFDGLTGNMLVIGIVP